MCRRGDNFPGNYRQETNEYYALRKSYGNMIFQTDSKLRQFTIQSQLDEN